MKEVRGNKLINIVKSVIPGAGFIKPADKDGRKVFFQYRTVDFIVSSRLHVQECGFGRCNLRRDDTPETEELSSRLKTAVVGA